MSSSSSSAPGLNRTRSLRQPTAGLANKQREDAAAKLPALNTSNGLGTSKGAGATSASVENSGNMSPSRLPKPGGSLTNATRSRVGAIGPASNSTGSIPSATTGLPGTMNKANSSIGALSRSSTVSARKPATQSTCSERPEPSKKPRPKSMIASSSRLTRSSTQGPSVSNTSSTSSTRPTFSGLSTNTTAAKPQSQLRAAHTRAKSTATSLTPATTLQPPRPPSAGSLASTFTTSTNETKTSKQPASRSNPVGARAGHQRQRSTTSSANTSALSGSNTSTATRPTRPIASDDGPRLRPAFNTLQQHYSPARNLAPKPLTSTYLAPPSPSKLPANVAISSETARLQAELLQLHLLHRDADAVSASWHASARERLGLRFTELAEKNAEVGKEEAASEEARNITALKSWGSSNLEEKIQLLDELVTGIWSLGEPRGRYARVVQQFEKWADHMVTAVESRLGAGGLGALMEGDEIAFVGELDPAWKDEVSSLARKLDSWRRQMANLGDGPPDEGEEDESQRSSLARIMAACHGQICGMLAELDIMEQIERDAISQDAAWIKRMNREGEGDDTLRAGAIWRAF